ncbi:YbaB/EbfC family nucleoid-associated protein [Glycomyces sp. TRM65418]|uniref:YbaB/EbfC family nucleoid-associated protein n=1 Tax=Glycomyces sp. TRM65418 TaxID=2867006 RepID=UPI001CE58B14|nr:YbaB/EbfC family nucleoid-associated protein [Glycomyces sp. TRM65418]MCC3763911.1 YbaB/EbfC family nucleoid-associated protein [Glycomyces sp. TRM65418]QZD53613.1 YbaB/EbfC family nucleoid-associated protein [Glycomyces sp. TRM65418]
MADRSRDPEEMFRRLEQMQAEAEATLEKYQRLSEEMGADQVEVVSEDGYIRVRLDAEGKVAEIGIDEYAMRMRQSLGPMIVAVIEQAKAEYGVKMTEMAQALLGDRMDVRGIVRDSLPEHMRDRFDREQGR